MQKYHDSQLVTLYQLLQITNAPLKILCYLAVGGGDTTGGLPGSLPNGCTRCISTTYVQTLVFKNDAPICQKVTLLQK